MTIDGQWTTETTDNLTDLEEEAWRSRANTQAHCNSRDQTLSLFPSCDSFARTELVPFPFPDADNIVAFTGQAVWMLSDRIRVEDW